RSRVRRRPMLIQIPNQHIDAALVKLGNRLDLNSLKHLVFHRVDQFTVIDFVNDSYSHIDRSVLEILLQSPELEVVQMQPTSFSQYLEDNPELEQQMSTPSQASSQLISFITDFRGYFFPDCLG